MSHQEDDTTSQHASMNTKQGTDLHKCRNIHRDSGDTHVIPRKPPKSQFTAP